MAIAGKVAITPKGEWNAQTAYTKLDLVFYDNASYVAIQPSTGVEPTNESYWMLMVQSAGGADLEAIIDGTQQVGNAKTLDGHEAEYFAQGTNGVANHASKLVQIHGGADLLEFALTVQTLEAVNFITGSNTANVPNGGLYSQGMILRRSEDTIDILLFARSTGKVWHNAYKGTEWSGWQSLASDADLAKYLPLTGGTLTKGSKITFEKSDDSTLSGNVDVSVSKNSFGISEKGGSVRGVTLDLTECANWNGSKLLHTGNMASHVLPLSGGGIVAKNGTKVMGIQNTNSEYTLFTFYGNTGELGSLGFDGADIPVFRPIAGSTYKLLHTGNKPTGTYTGNGDATARAINVGGIGNAVHIHGGGCSVIATPHGAFGINRYSTEIVIIPYTELNFENGKVNMSTTSTVVNTSGVTYAIDLL